MKERPILFSGPMVRAILEGRKTQTRRVVKNVLAADTPDRNGVPLKEDALMDLDQMETYISALQRDCASDGYSNLCPYGKPGDRLWVRETAYIWGRWVKNGLSKTGKQKWRFKIEARSVTFDPSHPQVATKKTPKERNMYWKRPSIHVPRWASRILLEITSVRVERLQEISEADAIAEGVERISVAAACLTPWKNYLLGQGEPFALNKSIAAASFMTLWDLINGVDAHKANPWVWAVTFKVVTA